MIRIVDRYIIRNMLLNYLILVAVLMILFVSIDLFVDLDEFIQAVDMLNTRFEVSRPLGWVRVLADYYGPLCMMIYVFVSGVAASAAVGFTILQMQRARELTAVVASGVSLRRLSVPIIVCCIAFNLLAIPVQDRLIPPVAAKLLRSKSDLKHPERMVKRICLASDGHGTLLSAGVFNLQQGTLSDVSLIMRQNGDLVKVIEAPEAKWIEAQPENTQGRWTFPQGAVAFDPQSQYGTAVQVKDWPSTLAPKVLQARQEQMFARLLSMRDMHAMMNNPALSEAQREGLRRSWWSRWTMPLLGGLTAMLSIPFFMTRLPHVKPRQAIEAMLWCLGAWCGGLLLMSASLLPPMLAAFSPIILVAGLVGWRFKQMET